MNISAMFRSSPGYIWVAICLLALVLARPVCVEILGRMGHADTVQMTVVSQATDSDYNYNSDSTTTYQSLLLQSKSGELLPVTLTDQLLPVYEGEQVIAGTVLGEIATINGTFVAALGGFELMGFAWLNALLLIALWLTRFCSLREPKQDAKLAALLAVLMGIAAMPLAFPALLAGLVMGLLFNIAWWPAAVLAVYVCTGILACTYIRPKVE